jgi:hypothetical protein
VARWGLRAVVSFAVAAGTAAQAQATYPAKPVKLVVAPGGPTPDGAVVGCIFPAGAAPVARRGCGRCFTVTARTHATWAGYVPRPVRQG